MLLGTGKAIITPPPGTWLAGYNNGRGADEVLHDLQLRVFWFQETNESPADEAVCLITAELLGFGNHVTQTLRGDLSKQFGLSPDAIMLAASHTHCGPQTCENMPNNGGPLVPEYIAQLRSHAIAATSEARENLRPTTLRVGRGKLSDFAVNRRREVEGEFLLAPNPEGVRDDEVTVVIGSDAESNEVSAVLFHYTCHPTLLGGPMVSGDYPGVALQYIEHNLKGACAGFLPGCFGDVRPNVLLIGGRKFRAASTLDVEEFGTALGAEVVRVVRENANSEPLHPQLSARAEVLPLPMQKEPEHTPLTLQRIELADELGIVAMGAEMGVDYGHFIKSLDDQKSWIPIGYANGLIGYVCPAYQYAEGGFEPFLSCDAYSLVSPFKTECETIIHQAIQRIVSQI